MHRRFLQQVASSGVFAGITAVATVLALRGPASSPVAAGPAQAGEVRASAFVLVGPDGAVRARLAVTDDVDVVNLEFFDRSGAMRTVVGQNGLWSFEPGGTRFSIVLRSGPAGGPSLVLSGEGGVQAALSETGLVVNDAAGRQRVVAGDVLSETVGGGPSGTYGIRVRDAEGATTVLLP